MLVRNSTVLVTGAGGSIGSELVRQLTALGAREVICVDRDEYALYRLQLELTGQAMLTDETTILARRFQRPSDGSSLRVPPAAARIPRRGM